MQKGDHSRLEEKNALAQEAARKRHAKMRSQQTEEEKAQAREADTKRMQKKRSEQDTEVDSSNDPEKNAFAAWLQYLLDSGLDRFKDVDLLPDKAAEEQLLKEIKAEILSTEEKNELFAKYRESCGRRASIYSCAACGIRQAIRNGVKYELMSMEELECLKLSDAEAHDHAERMKITVNVPIDEDGNGIKNIHPWKVQSVYKQDITSESKDPNTVHFHLHPEFVKPNKQHGFKARICSECKSYIEKGEVPEMSIANGVDFGASRRIHLISPNVTERAILARVRLYLTFVKLKHSEVYGHKKLKAHGIAFDHDSPERVTSLFDEDHIDNIIKMCFVGPEGEIDWMAKEAYGSSTIRGRAHVLYQWMAVLIKTHCQFSQLHLPPYNQVKATMERQNDKMMHTNAVQITDDNMVAMEETIDDDIAEVRNNTEDISEKLQNETNARENVIQIDHSYVTKRSKVQNDIETAQEVFINSCADAFQMDGTKHSNKSTKTVSNDTDNENTSPSEYNNGPENTIPTSKRSSVPLSEFDQNDIIFPGAFPDVFLLGKVYNRAKQGSLSFKQRKHLLLQFTEAAATSQSIIFYMFDQMQRHENIRGMSNTVKATPQAFEMFAQLCNSNEFKIVIRGSQS